MAADRGRLDQRIIDNEVRLSRSRALIEDTFLQRERWADAREAGEEAAWLRGRLAAMIAGASGGELEELGLTDDMVREAGLGNSLRDAWERLHPPHLG